MLANRAEEMMLGDMMHVAEVISERLHVAGFLPEEDWIRQTLNVAEEAGEFVGAVRRFRGMARRSGSQADMEAELADVIISSFIAAVALKIDLPRAIQNKLAIIFERGWRETSN